MVLIDQNPLRRETANDCRAVRVRLDSLRAAWNSFEREDKPAFARWRAREFGPLLSELRETETKIRELETLVHKVEMEMRRGFYDPHTAFQRVKARRSNPAAAKMESEPRSQPERGEERKLSDFEKEALFQEWLQKYVGTNPDKLDDDAYSTRFEAFKAHMFRSMPAEPLPRAQPRPAVRPAELPVEKEPEPSPIDARVKQLYRLLVRRLHPDLRADGSAAVSALWHEVQEAYAATDVAHLEILLALSDIQANPFREDMTVSQMRAVVKWNGPCLLWKTACGRRAMRTPGISRGPAPARSYGPASNAICARILECGPTASPSFTRRSTPGRAHLGSKAMATFDGSPPPGVSLIKGKGWRKECPATGSCPRG
jgi:hypothetical protein